MENELLEGGMHVKKHRPQHCYQCVADNFDGRDEATFLVTSNFCNALIINRALFVIM